MASHSLSAYDGSAGFLVDTNLWIDCMDPASAWHAWAVDQLQACSERAPLHVNLVIYTELLVPEPAVDALDALLDVYETQRSALPRGLAPRWPPGPSGNTGVAAGCATPRCRISSSARTRPWPT